MLKNQRGQVLVEFALSIILFFTFVFGLFALTMWGASSYFTQETAHEVARKYAVTSNEEEAKKRGQYYIKNVRIFLNPDTVDIHVWKEGTTAIATVKAEPAMKKYFNLSIDSITKQSEATIEHYIRNPEQYLP